MHCLPLTHAGNKAVGVMKAGQTFTIEPMINAGIFESLFMSLPSEQDSSCWLHLIKCE